MMYTYKMGISAKEMDDFTISNQQANLLQSSKWAIIKDNWQNERVGFYKNNELQATASILIKPLPFGFTMFYIPRGPIMDYTDIDLVTFVFQSLKKIGKTKRALFIKCDPSILLRQFHDEKETELNSETLKIIDHLTKLGLNWTGKTSDMGDNIQPRFQAKIFKDEFSYDLMPKKTKQKIRSAKNKGVTISFGHSDFISEFAKLMKKTEERKGIHLRNADYYHKLLQTYPKDSFITMASLNLKKRMDLLSNQLKEAKDKQSQFNEKTRKSKIETVENDIKRLSGEIDFLRERMAKDGENPFIAGTLTLEFGDTSENIYAGMDDHYKRYTPAIYTWFETAQHSFERGKKWQNMGGVENDLSGGLFKFKSVYQPTFEEFAGEFNLPVSPLYKVSNWAYRLRKKLRNKH